MIGFSFPDKSYSMLNGGFAKVDEISGANAPKLYFYVRDLVKVMEVREQLSPIDCYMALCTSALP